MRDLDKDIHMLKSYAGMTHKLTDNQGRPKLDQAIENVVRELEIARDELKRLVKRLVEVDHELKTWKKIAEKLVSYGESYGLDVDIDWARKEVEKDG